MTTLPIVVVVAFCVYQEAFQVLSGPPIVLPDARNWEAVRALVASQPLVEGKCQNSHSPQQWQNWEAYRALFHGLFPCLDLFHVLLWQQCGPRPKEAALSDWLRLPRRMEMHCWMTTAAVPEEAQHCHPSSLSCFSCVCVCVCVCVRVYLTKFEVNSYF